MSSPTSRPYLTHMAASYPQPHANILALLTMSLRLVRIQIPFMNGAVRENEVHNSTNDTCVHNKTEYKP